jgi:pimeloyl-ACP methyl ester carboxylesterase
MANAVEFRNANGLRLAGDLYPVGEPDALIIFLHGFMSDRHSSGRYDYLAECFRLEGYSGLTFDFSGSGESDDAPLSMGRQVADLSAAIDYAKGLGYRRIALWANSMGSVVAVRGWRPEIGAMVLTGAALGPVFFDWSEVFTSEQHQELARTGLITAERTSGPRRRLVVDGVLLREFETFDRAAVLGRITAPALIINGDGDDEERMLQPISAQALAYLPAGSEQVVVPGAPHGFRRHLDEVRLIGLRWLLRHMPPRPQAAA